MRHILPFVGRGVPVGGTYATFNPVDTAANSTLSNGNKTITGTTASAGFGRATNFVAAGEHKYWEVTVDVASNTRIGGATSAPSNTGSLGENGGVDFAVAATGLIRYAGGNIASITAPANGDILGFEYDRSLGTPMMMIYRNGTLAATVNVGNQNLYPACGSLINASQSTLNCGPTMAYSIPSGASLIS